MSSIKWGEGSRDYGAGLDRGVLYPSVGPGVAWNGLISVVESTDDVREFEVYVDGQKVNQGSSSGAFSAELNAYTYPTEFYDYSGVDALNRTRSKEEFGLSYRVPIGSGGAYEIHLVYLARATPTESSHKSIDAGSEAETMAWSLTTRPIFYDDKAISHLIMRSIDFRPGALAAIEAGLYGAFGSDPHILQPQEILDIIEQYAIFKVTDNGDGTATISGPDEAVYALDATTWRLDWPSVVQIDGETYRLSSL